MRGFDCRCPIPEVVGFSPYISNLEPAKSGSHDRGDISLRSIDGSQSQHDYRSIDRPAISPLVVLVGEFGEEIGVV